MTVWSDGKGTWTLGPLELKKIACIIFFELMVLLAVHGRFLSFRFRCLLSALRLAQTCAPRFHHLIALEITRLLQPLYVFKSPRAHLRHCVFCSSVSKWGTHLAQTFLRSKRFFRIVCTLPSDMPVQLAMFWQTIAHPVRPQSLRQRC